MKIQKVNELSFGRKPNAREMQVYTKSVESGLKLLNKEIDVIIHNASMPSLPEENTGIGSMFSLTTIKKFIPFLKNHVIKGIQIEPINMRKVGDNSPYAPESSAKNIFMIPLSKLSSDEYNNLLSKKTFVKIVSRAPKGDRVNYDYVAKNYEKALLEAYKNFKSGDFLKKEFDEYKAEKGEYLEKAAIFRILNGLYKKPWTKWEQKDKILFSPVNKKQENIVKERLSELKKTFAEKIDFFIFNQFIIDRENAEFNKEISKTGMRIIGDSPVASPASDEWIHQRLFLKGKALGCPPDHFSKSGQRWGFRYFDPERIFNSDGTLGEAGKILKAKYEDFFTAFPGGLRIDHVIGLVDPFIYTTSEKMTPRNSGRIYSQFTGKYQKKQNEYSNIVEKIVLSAAKKLGVSKSDIICEDLGEPNAPTISVMKKLGLSGIAVTQFGTRGANVPEKNIIMIGSHDNKSLLEHTEEVFEKKEIDNNFRKEFLKQTKTLAEDTISSDCTKKEKSLLTNLLRKDKYNYMLYHFAELFTSPAKRVQIFFTDFWGIPKTYNIPGTAKGNWELRLGENFEDDYYRAVSDGKAINLPKVIAIALKHRGLEKENKSLVDDLNKLAQILDEK